MKNEKLKKLKDMTFGERLIHGMNQAIEGAEMRKRREVGKDITNRKKRNI